jgi:hypothetical protein
MYLPQVASDMTELHEETLNIPCGSEYDPVLVSVFEDLPERMLILPQDPACASNDEVTAYHQEQHFQEEQQYSGYSTLEEHECAGVDGNYFLNLSEESGGEEDATTSVENSKSASSSLRSLPGDLFLTATSNPAKVSTPVSSALAELSSFANQEFWHTSPPTSMSATTSAANSSYNLPSICPVPGNMPQAHPAQKPFMPQNLTGELQNPMGREFSPMQFGTPIDSNGGGLLEVPRTDPVSGQLQGSAPPRRYKIMQPSKFCHVCVRSGELVTLAPCANVTTGVCRKAICRKCFEKHGHVEEWHLACNNNSLLAAELTAPAGCGPVSRTGCLPEFAWTCLHCRDLCPDSAQCKIYARTNKRRHLMLKQRKAEKSRCSGERQGNHGVTANMQHKMFSIGGGIRRPSRPQTNAQTTALVAGLLSSRVDHSTQYQQNSAALSSGFMSSVSSMPKSQY